MTIRKRIIIAVSIQAAIIVIICAFVYFSFNMVLSRLRAIEIIDDLNISFLEIRRAEKNYFLYNDANALQEVIDRGTRVKRVIQPPQEDIFDSLGHRTHEVLLTNLKEYLELAQGVVQTKAVPLDFEKRFRQLGHEMTQVSELLLRQERKNVNIIIYKTVFLLIASLGLVLFFQLGLGRYFFFFIIKELAIMERMIHTVSEGRFHEVAVEVVSPKNEIEFAIKAISDMAKELEKREEVIIQGEKMASLGVLISGVAHELGNPLNNIAMMAQGYLSLYDILGDEERKGYMTDVLNQIERISKIINNLLDFSRRKKQELKECSPEELVDRSLALVDNQLKISKVKLNKAIDAHLPKILVDAGQIEQVLVNLYINAISAMPGGGDLLIQVDREKENHCVVFKIKDNGSGIDKETLPHIFDPFFTTKGTKGTGLGLAVSYGIIRQHQGEISVESEVGQGTTFTIKLPASQHTEGE